MSTTTFNLIGINGPSGFLATSGNTWMQAYVTGSPLTLYDLTTTSSFDIVDGSFSGRIYLLAGTGTAPSYTAETDIIPGAVAANQRFAVYELNLGNAPSDVLDITAENGLGFNLSAESVTTNGNYYTGAAVPFSVGTTGLAQQVAAVNPSAVISSGAYDMMFGASGAPGSGYWPSTDWTTYITDVRTTGSVINSMAFGGVYGIPAASATNPNYEQIYNYRAYSTSYADQTGTMLYPVALNVNMPTGWIQATDWVFVPDATLQANVYQPGAAGAYITTFSNGQLQNPTQQLLSTTPPYNSTALMMTALVAGFDAGFYGSFGTNANPLVFDKVDLNKSWNANWNYAYQGYLMEGITPGNGTSLGSSSVGSVFNNGSATVLGGGYYDAYAAIVSKSTNVYAWPYSDYLSKWGGTPPIIPLYDGATGANVATVNLTVYGDAASQPAQNFLAPSANYLAGYGGVNLAVPGNNIQFNMTYGSYNNGGTNTYVTPDQNTSLTFRIYAAGQGLPNTDSQGFLNFNLNGLFTSGGNFSNWTNFVFTQDATTQAWSVASNGVASAATPGFVNFQNVPVVQSGTAWYQLILGNGAHASTYNIYSVANASGQFTQMVADHSITPTSGVNIPGFSPPTVAPLSAPNSTPTTSAQIGLAGNYITFDVATFEAPRFSRFADGPLANDTLLINANTGQIANWQLNGSGQVIGGSGLLSATLLAGWQVAATGSFAAGTHDVLLSNLTATGTTQLATWTVNGTTVTPNPLVSAELGVGWSILGIGAFTGGLDNQILLQNFDHAAGTQQLAYWQLDNAGQITAGGNIGGPLGNGWTVAGTGNLLGNGRTDILLQNGTNLAIWELNDSGQLAQAANINQQLTPGWEVVGLGNFFSTSPDQDILLKNGNQVAMWQLNGFDVGQQGLVSTLLPGWAIAGVGDYNTDGMSDILLQNGNQFAEWMMNGMTVQSTAQVGSQLSTGWNLLGTGNL